MRLVRYSYPTSRSPALATGSFSRSPWSGIETEIDRLFETALDGLTKSASAGSRFPVDLYEDKNNTYVRAELPGVNRDDIHVEVVDGFLSITATRKTPAYAASSDQTAEGEGQAEPAFSFSRSVSINDDVQTDQVSAAYENGVLTVTLPKREEAKPKKINVAVK